MTHITEEYGQKCNLLSVSSEDLDHLEGFLKELGVRVRVTRMFGDICFIQGENPYKIYAGQHDGKAKAYGDEAMSDSAIYVYKR